jgi:phage major head subunit gpT-like protein
MALKSENFADVLDPRFKKIFADEYTQVPDRVGTFYNVMPGRLQTERFSSVGTLGDIPQFTGTLGYDDVFQGYDVAITPLEFAAGIQIERRLFDDDLFNIIDQKPRALSQALYRLRQSHAVRPFTNAFSQDSFFYSHSEGVALCSNSHTTTSSSSTATGFDNLVTTGLSAVALASARIQMVGFRGDRAEVIGVMPSMLLVPPDLYETAYEIVGSQGKVDTANNNANVHYGQYNVEEWIYLSDTNDWFLCDANMMKSGRGLVWMDRNKGEFSFVEDFDTFNGKWRVYARWGNAYVDWRWVLGAQVS